MTDAQPQADDARPVDAPSFDSGPPPKCGCPDGATSCISGNVFEWTDRTSVGPTDGLSVYVVTQLDYEPHAAPLAVATPDATGRVVIDGLPATSDVYIVLDDASDSGMDRWSHTGVGPVDLPAVTECIDMPAVLRTHGDAFLTDAGFPPDGPSTLGGSLILEVLDETGAPRELIGLEMSPDALTHYFTADREHLDPFLSSTTSAGALMSAPATYCSQLCRNITCTCGDPTCGVRPTDQGGASNGFFFATMACHR